MTPLTKYDRDKLHSDFDKFFSEMKSVNEHIAAMIAKINDKSDKKIEKQLQLMSFQIADISSKYSENIQYEVLTITSEHPYYEDQIERKPQDKISPYNQSFEHPEEELIEFKGEEQMDPNNLSSEHIENKMVTLTSETLSSEYFFETKLHARLSKSDLLFEQPEE